MFGLELALRLARKAEPTGEMEAFRGFSPLCRGPRRGREAEETGNAEDNPVQLASFYSITVFFLVWRPECEVMGFPVVFHICASLYFVLISVL